MSERIKLTEQVIREMRLACCKRTYSVGGTEYRTEKANVAVDPHCWWYENKAWWLSIRCKHNAHGEYYIALSTPMPGHEDWFCFLHDGKWGSKFLHLRHVTYFDDLVRIVSALTDLRLCLNEQAAKQYLDEYPMPA